MIVPAQCLRVIRPVSPFYERRAHNGMTFGLGPAGYDIRVAEDLELRHGSFVLASSVERFYMPLDLLGQVCDKSTWARRGVTVQNTIIEPGWRGHLTLEIACHSTPHNPIDILAGDPIAQVIFFKLTEPTTMPYSGKYQDQQAGPQAAREG